MLSVDSTAPAGTGCPIHTGFEEVTFLDPKILADPAAFYSMLRAQDLVQYDPKLEMYLVSRFEDLMTVVRDPITFSVAHGYEETNVKGFAEEFKQILIRDGGGYFEDIIMTDPPKHTRAKRLMEKAFTAHRVKTLEPRMGAIVAELIDQLADKGNADGVNEFAVPATIKMICGQFGFDQFDVDNIQRWSHAATSTISRMQTREDMLVHAQEMGEMQLYLIDHIKRRQEQRGEDLISDLVYAEIDDPEARSLAFGEIVALARPMLVAGNETTATALGNLLLLLATKPAVVQALEASVGDDRLLNRFVEELLRLEPPVRGLSRMTTKEVELGGVTLPARAHLLLLFASANDDEAEFQCPRDFKTDRPNLGRHLAFSAGAHRCIGAPLARMEIKIAAKELWKRFEKIELTVPVEALTFIPTIATRSLASLPLKFTVRA